MKVNIYAIPRYQDGKYLEYLKQWENIATFVMTKFDCEH